MIRTAPAYVVPTRAALAAARAALYRARPIFLVNGPVKLSLGTFPGDFPAAAHTALRAHGRWVRRLARDGCWTITDGGDDRWELGALFRPRAPRSPHPRQRLLFD